jgi:hypothetical protein
MTQVKIEIIRGEDGLVRFCPENQGDVTTLDNVFWVNNDEEDHWPAPEGQADNFWLSDPILGTAPDEPNTTSGSVAFFNPDEITQKAPPYTTTYICAKHRDQQNETGTIPVTK